jgi:hypothetical protein
VLDGVVQQSTKAQAITSIPKLNAAIEEVLRDRPNIDLRYIELQLQDFQNNL